MKTSLIRLALAALALTLGAFHPSRAFADAAAISFTGGGTGGTGDDTIGWSFTLTSSVTVTQLGYYDYGADGLAQAHAVGIYTTSGSTPLVSVTVPAGTGTTLLNSFRYVPVTPTLLTAGTYDIGGFFGNGSTDYFIGGTPVITPAAGLTYGTGLIVGGPSLANPTSNIGYAVVGPNFQFTPTPEPGSGLLLTMGACAVLGRRRRAAV